MLVGMTGTGTGRAVVGRRTLLRFGLLAGLPLSWPVLADQGRQDDHQRLVDAARAEGRLTVYGSTAPAQAGSLIQGFADRYPGVVVDYRNLEPAGIRDRVVAEQARGRGTADLQVQLVADGHALTYASPEAPALPRWAVWRDQAYATSAEPVAIAYNKRLLPEGDVPKSHADLLALLRTKPDAYRGKVATVDPERTSADFLLLSEDLAAWPEAWALVGALGEVGVVLHTSGSTVLDGIASGRYLIGYDVLASAARARARRDPDVAWVLPQDFTVVVSRVAFVARAAGSPNAAKLFLDFLLSREGQEVMAGEADLYALRKDVAGELTLAGVAEAVGEGLWPVPLDERLLRNLGVVRRRTILDRWRAAVRV
jgi:iron(III) transport system substrate-binding protein